MTTYCSAKKDPKSPASSSYEYDRMAPRWEKMNAVLGGTESMREAERAHLPQHSEEKDRAYAERLSTATLLNYTSLTLESWVGRPFSDPAELVDAPAGMEAIRTDVDRLGNDLGVFLRNWFRDGMAKAFSHVLVDMPRVEVPEGQLRRTLADDARDGVRPYWVHVKPEDLIYARSEIVGGREVVVHARIREVGWIRNGWVDVPEDRIRVLEPGHVQLWAFRKPEKGSRAKWVMYDEYTTDYKDEVPLATFYADRDAFMLGKSPLDDLADLNISHWQSSSDQRAVLTVARFPILALSGGTDEDKKLVIGPNQWLWCPDPQGRYYYVEHGGAAIAAGRQDMVDLEEQMALYGAEFLRRRPGNPTATARALDTAESTSPLQDAVKRFSDAAARVLEHTAHWLGDKDGEGGTVRLANDWAPAGDGQDVVALLQARTEGDLSPRGLMVELQRRGFLGDWYSWDNDKVDREAEMKRLDDQAAKEAERAQSLKAAAAPPKISPAPQG